MSKAEEPQIDPAEVLTSASRYSVPVEEGRLQEAYDIGKAVGKGGYAIVYKGTRKEDGRIVAVKKVEVFEMAVKKRERCLQEVKLLKGLNHPNVIQMLDAFIDENMLIIVFEWAPQGDLKRLIRKAAESGKRLDEPSIWAYFSQIADGLLYMHKERIMHRDIKPANVLVGANGALKIGDLGLGRQLSEQTMEAFSKVGTPYYVSPEVIKGLGYDWKSDVWSLGCLLYELAQLRSPFEVEGAGANLYDVFQKISKGDYEPLPLDSFSSQLRSLVGRMLMIDPSKRPELENVWNFTQDVLKSQLQGSTKQDVHSTAEQLVWKLLFLEDHVLMQPSLPPPPLDALRSVHPLFLAEPLGSSKGSGCTSWDLAGEQKIQLGIFSSIFSWLLHLLGRPELVEPIESILEHIPTPGEAAASQRRRSGSQGGRTPQPPLPPHGPSAVGVRGSSPASKSRPGRTLVAGPSSSNSSSRAATPPKERERGSNGDGASRQPTMAPTPPATPPQRPSLSSTKELSGFLPSSTNLLRGAGAIKKAAQAVGLDTEFAPVQAIALGHGRAVCSLLHDLLLLVFEKVVPKTKAGLVGHVEHPYRAPREIDEDSLIQEMDDGAVIEASDPLPPASQPLEQDDDVFDDFLEKQPVSNSNREAKPAPEPSGGIMESKIDPVAWKQELERVGPRLRILLNADAKDWRSNLEEVHANSKTIAASWPNSRVALDKLQGEVKESLERLRTRERHINDQFGGLMDGYRAQRKLLGQIQANYNTRNDFVIDRHNELHLIGEQLSEMKSMMDEQGQTISDATPVVRIRNAIRDLTAELKDMEVRLGVLKSQQLRHEHARRVSAHQISDS